MSAKREADMKKLIVTMETILEDFSSHESFAKEVTNESYDYEEIEFRFDEAKPLYEKYNDAYLKLYSLSNENDKKVARELSENFKKRYFKTIALLKKLLNHQDSSTINNNQNVSTSVPHNASAKIHLPKMEIPKFDGNIEQWLRFKDIFESLIHNNVSLNGIQKFHYLKEAIKLPDKEVNVLDTFTVAEEFYEDAWKAVKNRYHDIRKIKSKHLSSIMNVKPMSGEMASEIRRIIDTYSSHLNSLKALGSPIEYWDDMIVHIVVQKLDDETGKWWHLHNQSDSPSWSDLLEFLTRRWRSIDVITPAKRPPQKLSDVKPQIQFKPAKTHFANEINHHLMQQSDQCPSCNKNHFLYKCPTFFQMKPEARMEFIKKLRLCMKCFSKTHIASSCLSQRRCKICNGNHHTMIHTSRLSYSNGNMQQQENSPSAPSQGQMPNQAQTVNQYSMNQQQNQVKPFVPSQIWQQSSHISNCATLSSQTFELRKQTLLSTAIIEIADYNGKFHQCRALLDQGSDTNFITSKLANKLQLNLKNVFMPLSGIEERISVVKQHTSTVISSMYSDFKRTLEFSILNNITGRIPTYHLNPSQFKIPTTFKLADPTFYESSAIDILLNVSLFYDCLLDGKMRIENGPIMIHTSFGWILGGDFVSQIISPTSLLSCLAKSHWGMEEFDSKLEKFWTLENYESKEPHLTPEEKYCETLYSATTTRDKNGRYIVQIPFKENSQLLGNNIKNATRCLFQQEAMLLKNPQSRELHNKFMQEYIKLGHMKEVRPMPNEPCYYLPHHGVLKESSTSTKWREVFNGSSKSEPGVSLNDVTCVGPTIQPETFDILIRFREHQFVLKSDIEKMYRQINVIEEHQPFQRILWRADKNEPIKHFNLLTVTYGTGSAPFLSARTIKQLAIENESKFPEACKIIQNSIFVDDCLFGCETIEECHRTTNVC